MARELSKVPTVAGQDPSRFILQKTSFLYINSLRLCYCSHGCVFSGEQIAEETMELKAKELETATSKLASADALNLELKQTMHKLQQDVLKLRAALEQSITSLNRMSSDSDFYVDRFCSQYALRSCA